MIRKIYIENYKSIDIASLTFNEINVLIGKNGAGKTTLISVINMLRKLSTGANINSVVNSVAPFGGEFFNANTDSTLAKFGIEVQAPNGQLYSYSFSVAFGDERSAHRELGSFYFASERLARIDFDGKQLELIFQRSNDDSSIEVHSDDSRLVAMPLNVDRTTSVLSNYAQEDAKLITETLSSYSVIWVDAPQKLNQFDIVSSNDIDLGTIDGVAVDLYIKDRKLFNDAMKAVASIIPGFTPPDIADIRSAKRSPTTLEAGADRKKIVNYLVSWSDSNYSRSYGVSRLSLSGGNSRVIYLILSLYNSDSSSCFVAEEIENGMHLSRIAKLIDQMRMIVKNRKIQLFFTTHNHLILDDLLPKEVIFAKLTDKGSTYSRLSESKEYKDIEADLGRAPSSSEVVESGLLFS